MNSNKKIPTKKSTVQKLAEIMQILEPDIQLNFSKNEDGSDYYGVIRKKLFGGDVLLLGYYGGFETSLFNLVNQHEGNELPDWLEYCIGQNKAEIIYMFETEKPEQSEKIKENIVSSFFFYMWNAWCKEECKKVFGWESEHFWSKWVGQAKDTAWGAAEKFYAELSGTYRVKLVARACEIYDGNARRENNP